MIARVFGRIDGVEVEFKNEGNFYIMEFPKKLDSGNYIIEVYAEDMAGNVSYCSTLLYTIDPSGACVHVSPAQFYLTAEEDSTSLELVPQKIYLEAIPCEKCRGGT